MSRLLRGHSAPVPVLSANPSPTDEGLDTSKLADRTATFGQTRAEVTALVVAIEGSGTIQLVLWAFVVADSGDLGWTVLYDTNNPGMLGGGPLPAPGVYTFLVSHAMIFEQILIVQQNATVDANVTSATMINYEEDIKRR